MPPLTEERITSQHSTGPVQLGEQGWGYRRFRLHIGRALMLGSVCQQPDLHR